MSSREFLLLFTFRLLESVVTPSLVHQIHVSLLRVLQLLPLHLQRRQTDLGRVREILSLRLKNQRNLPVSNMSTAPGRERQESYTGAGAAHLDIMFGKTEVTF